MGSDLCDGSMNTCGKLVNECFSKGNWLLELVMCNNCCYFSRYRKCIELIVGVQWLTRFFFKWTGLLLSILMKELFIGMLSWSFGQNTSWPSQRECIRGQEVTPHGVTVNWWLWIVCETASIYHCWRRSTRQCN